MRLRFSPAFLDYNREMFFGFIGAIIGAPLLSFIVSRFTSSLDLISASAVAGDILGGAVMWVGSRIYFKIQRGKYSALNLTKDIAYFTPAAFVIAVLVLYPTIFFLSKSLINNQVGTILSVMLSQLVALLLFVLFMNIYRIVLIRFFGKVL
ncbi:MAG: hypothetical protein NUV46_02955 [Nanoarchaeota archaeon]|nr:hypothetical protein [Nanoarchaeota archaeon]